MTTSENKSPRISFDEDDKRPYVVAYVQKPDFHVGDKVFLVKPDRSHEGPYLISSVPSAGKCTLCLEDGGAVKNGELIDMDTVKAA